MAITPGVTTSFRTEMLQAEHDLLSDSLMMALYKDTATLSKATTIYSATDEVSGAGYTSGGKTLTGVSISSLDEVVMVTFTAPTWAGATFSAQGALIYNATNANKSVAVFDFGGLVSAAAETFQINLPPVTPSGAIIRFP